MRDAEAQSLLNYAHRSRVRARLMHEQTWFEFLAVGAGSLVTVSLSAVVGHGVASAAAGVVLTLAAVAIVLRERRRRRAIGGDNVPFIHVASVAEAAAVGIALKSTYLNDVFLELTPSRALAVSVILVAAAMTFSILRRRMAESIVVGLGAVTVAAAYIQLPHAVWPVGIAATGTLLALGVTQRLEAGLSR